MCSPDNSPPLEGNSPDEKVPLLVVGDGSDWYPILCGEEGCGIDTLNWPDFDDELNPVAPDLVVNPFVTDISVVPAVVSGVDPLVADVPIAPEGLVWLGRML